MNLKEAKPTLLQQFYADRVIDFIKHEDKTMYDHMRLTLKQSPVQIKQLILKHMEYNTIVVLWDKAEIIAVCVFNIEGDVADINYVVIRKDQQFRNLLKRMTVEGKLRYPYVKKLSFERFFKYKSHKTHQLNLDQWLATK
jgi:hypothetical protein